MSNAIAWLGFGVNLAVVGCGHEDRVELYAGVPARVNECSVLVHNAYSDLVDMEFTCSAPESALSEAAWWGEGDPPGAVGLGRGDCVRLRKRYYCVTSTAPTVLEPLYEVNGVAEGPILRSTRR